MKLYVISGLGADFKVLERLRFPDNVEVEFLPWLEPKVTEPFADYVERMAERIDFTSDYMLLGYSFGGIIVQEIHKRHKAKKVVILGSIRSGKEKPTIMRVAAVSGIPKFLPVKWFDPQQSKIYNYIRSYFDATGGVENFFTIRNPYYLKWSLEKIASWNGSEQPEVIQIMGEKDRIFPLKYSRPDYVIKGGTHLFPATRSREVSQILEKVLSDKTLEGRGK